MSETYWPRFPPESCLETKDDAELDSLKAENERLRNELEETKVRLESATAEIGALTERLHRSVAS